MEKHTFSKGVLKSQMKIVFGIKMKITFDRKSKWSQLEEQDRNAVSKGWLLTHGEHLPSNVAMWTYMTDLLHKDNLRDQTIS